MRKFIGEFMEMVTIEKNKAFTNSLVIAENTGNEHRAVLQLIGRHKASIEEFGAIAFEMRNPENNGLGGRPVRIAKLNEGQATFLMTLLKNSKKVVRFKIELVKAFVKARDLLMTGQMGLMQKHAVLTLALGEEKESASHCGKGLSDWKRKRDMLQAAIENVERQIQPDFFTETAQEAVFYACEKCK